MRSTSLPVRAGTANNWIHKGTTMIQFVRGKADLKRDKSQTRRLWKENLGDRELVRILTDSASRNRITGKEITVGLFSRMHDKVS